MKKIGDLKTELKESAVLRKEFQAQRAGGNFGIDDVGYATGRFRHCDAGEVGGAS
jgi:hypothetical protein